MTDYDLRVLEEGAYEDIYEEFEWDIPERHNLAVDVCDRWADDRSRVALHWEDSEGAVESYTFTGLARRSNQFANALRAHDVECGDVVAVFVPTLPEAIVAMLGTLKLGAICMPLYHLFGPEGISPRLEAAEPVVIVTDTGGLEKLGQATNVPEDVFLVRNDDPRSDAATTDFDAALSAQARTFEPVATAPTDPAVLFYTSGTTGDPKGVLQPHQYSIGQRYIGQYMRDYTPEDVLWHSGDLAWAGGFANLIEAWTLGMPMLKYRGKFEARKALELFEAYGVTLFVTAPTALRAMMDIPRTEIADYDLDLRLVAAGGERVTPDLIEWVEETFDVFATIGWGQTECYGVGYPPLGADRDRKRGALGRPLPGFEATILDESGNELSPGEVGEMAIACESNPCMFSEYFDDPEATAAVTEGRWHRTGDVATVDEDGFFWFRGRDDDVIISSGYRISPAEVESSLNAHPTVFEAAVVGVPDKERTNVPKAFVQLIDDAEESDDLRQEIQTHVKDELAKFQYPRKVAFVTELPKTITGKIERNTLRERERDQ